MSLETILALLKGTEKETEIIKDVKATLKEDVTQAKSEVEESFKAEVSKRNKENQSLRSRVKKITDAFSLDLDDDDLDETIEEMKKSLKGGNEGKSEVERKLAKLEKSLEKERQERADEKEASENEKKELKLSGIKKDAKIKITQQLKELKALGEDDLADILMGKLHIDEDGETTLKLDGKNVDIIDGVKSWLEPKKHFIGNGQNPGGESGKGGEKGEPNTNSRGNAVDKMEGAFKSKS